jgi:hypothetical protein
MSLAMLARGYVYVLRVRVPAIFLMGFRTALKVWYLFVFSLLGTKQQHFTSYAFQLTYMKKMSYLQNINALFSHALLKTSYK